MSDNNVWSITGSGRSLSVEVNQDEPSHIHIPRPGRVMRPDTDGPGAPGRLVCPQKQIDAYRELLPSPDSKHPQAA